MIIGYKSVKATDFKTQVRSPRNKPEIPLLFKAFYIIVLSALYLYQSKVFCFALELLYFCDLKQRVMPVQGHPLHWHEARSESEKLPSIRPMIEISLSKHYYYGIIR